MTARLVSALLMLVVAASGCGKSSPGDSPAPTPSASSASTAASPSASGATPVPSASASAAPADTRSRWAGTYTSAPGSFYVYDGGEWKGVHFRGDDAAVALGDGPLSFTVDPKTNLVRGEGSGPLGDLVLTGAVTGEEVTFTLLRKDPLDRGLTGTGVGKIAGNIVSGTMHLSRADAHVIREATFSVTKDGAKQGS